jgi:hypothetical protein
MTHDAWKFKGQSPDGTFKLEITMHSTDWDGNMESLPVLVRTLLDKWKLKN